jgi:hypothetical protein
MKLSRKKILIAVKYLVLVAIIAELVLRVFFGLGHLPVYITNKHYEYIYAPDQDLYRFGNHIKTNSLGLRSPEFSKKDKIRILKIGDSVINGGAHVDQDNLSSSLLTKMLSKELQEQVAVYNISAQSWGPDNAFAFIKEHGDFDASTFLLVFSSHDLHDNMHFKEVVGEHKAWPSKQPLCAVSDACSRYLFPKVKSWFGYKEEEYDYLFDFDNSKLNPGWLQFFDYCKLKKIKLLVYLHATMQEVKSQSYDSDGKQIIEMLKQHEIEYILGLDNIKKDDFYRDQIHLNTKGHKRLAEVLFPYLK